MAVKQKTIVMNGIKVVIAPDTSRGGNNYILILPGGKKLPAGSRLNTTKNTIDLPGGKHLSFRDGKIIQNTPVAKRDRLGKTTYTQTEYGTNRPVAPTPAKKVAQPRSGDDRRQQMPTPAARPAKAAPARPRTTAPAPAAAAPPAGGRSRQQVIDLQRQLNAKGAGLVVDGVYGPKTSAAEKRFAGGGSAGGGRPPATATTAGTPRAAAPATSSPARPGSAAPTGAAPAKSAPAGGNVDAEVRRMFGDVAAFLSDPELGPILRKAATEGWDNSRLFGALQQTKFWKTKGDSERKWIILNRLDNATAKSQVNEQMQGITDLTRQAGISLNGLQIHDLAVNALKFGWSGSQVREQAFKIVEAKPGGLDTAVTQNYGYLAAFLDNAEVGPLLNRAAKEGWTQQRLEAELLKTNFWKTTTDAQRRFNAMQEQAPGEATQMVAARQSELLTLAQSLGVQVKPDRLSKIAEDSLRFGWNAQQMRASISAEFDYVGGESGLAGQSSRQIKELAGQYLVPISDQMLEKWTEQIVAGTADEEGFRSYLVEQAKSLFPGMAGALDKGVTVAQYADPYKQIAARELEMNPEQIDLNDPRFRTMLDQVNSKGERVSMTLSESAEYLRKLPEWQQTRGANEKAAALTENILRTFGAVA